MMLGLAFGGGVLLSGILGGRTGNSEYAPPLQREHNHSDRGTHGTQVNQTLETLKGALIGITATKLRNMLDQVIPGFKEQYEKMERSGSSNRIGQSEHLGREFEPVSHSM